MDYLENEFQDKFKDQKITSEDFDDDGLWDGISGNLPASGTRLTIWSKYGMIIITGIFSLTITLFLANYILDKNRTKVKDEVSILNSSRSSNPVQNDTTSTANGSNDGMREESSQSEIEKREVEKETTETREEKSDIQKEPQEAIQILKEKANSSLSALIKEGGVVIDNTNQTHQAESIEGAHEMVNAKTDTQKESMDENPFFEIKQEPDYLMKEQTGLARKHIDHIPNLSRQFVKLESLDGPYPFVNVMQISSMIPSAKPKKMWSLNTYGGTNALFVDHRSSTLSDLVALKNSTDHHAWGYSVGANASVRALNKLNLRLGFEYHQTWINFTYDTKSTSTRINENQLVTVWVDENSGQVIKEEYDDVVVPIHQTRSINHFNKIDLISLPIEAGFSKSFGRIDLGLWLGPVLHFAVDMNGRTIDANGELAEFGIGDSALTPFRQFGLGMRFSPTISYALNERWALSLLASYTYHPSKEFDQTDLQSDIHQLNLNMGIRHNFNAKH